MSGFSTNGLPAATLPLTGNELIAADTQLSGGQSPQSEAISVSDILSAAGAGQLQTLTYNSTAVSWDVSAGAQAAMTFGAGAVATFSIPVANAAPGQRAMLTLKQDGTGSRVVTAWGAEVDWASGTAPTLSTGANAIDVLEFQYNDFTGKWTGKVFAAAIS